MRGLHLGKFFGVLVKIGWSWLLIFATVSWSLASTFGQAYSEWTFSTKLEVASLAALLFFLSMLPPELAHSLVANSRKHPVRNITLFPFGGVSDIQMEPTSPWNEFGITIAEPMPSFGLGGSFILWGTREAILNKLSAADAWGMFVSEGFST